ncbi:VOC family protein [Leptothoe spongobia]|uniref:VOC family protein n=1 Tax=Leptothoe spongobia TAU-MAC 1115 TaxID=1967444 RepID=A0A947GQR1_9CYAN|nr:VOC family protein [Leptothoe spongobia]MBT9317171.1 VOC family protein [Leptothoe spongobia TAU-MAC 1115]
MKLSPYLSFNGCCETAFKFYEQCLGGKIESMMPYKGSPMEAEVSAEWGNKVMHGEFKLGEFVLMGSDCMPGKYEAAKGTSLMIGIEDPVEAERAFNALAENGKVVMPIQETFWAEKFGVLEDQFGIPWMINCDKPM